MHAFPPVLLVMSVIEAEEIVSLKIISFLILISIIFNDWISGTEITPLLKGLAGKHVHCGLALTFYQP